MYDKFILPKNEMQTDLRMIFTFVAISESFLQHGHRNQFDLKNESFCKRNKFNLRNAFDRHSGIAHWQLIQTIKFTRPPLHQMIFHDPTPSGAYIPYGRPLTETIKKGASESA